MLESVEKSYLIGVFFYFFIPCLFFVIVFGWIKFSAVGIRPLLGGRSSSTAQPRSRGR